MASLNSAKLFKLTKRHFLSLKAVERFFWNISKAKFYQSIQETETSLGFTSTKLGFKQKN